MEEVTEFFRVKIDSNDEKEVERSNTFNSITRLIQEQEKPVIATSYFAVLMSLIFENQANESALKLSVESLLFILSMVLPAYSIPL